VAEIQGLYGPFIFPEKLLQKIWLRREFATDRLACADGRPLEIIDPGRWNLLGGPDFKDARLRLAGRPVTGDVELHLRAGDWLAHGHTADPAYDRVVLHVVLFPPAPGAPAVRTSAGVALPALVLLSRLHHDLEEYATDAAVEALAARDDFTDLEALGCRPWAERSRLLRELADGRWRQKVRFAGLRIARLGWSAAGHHTALEILGYRFNRAPMLRIAGAFPLEQWPELGEDQLGRLLAAEAGTWSVQGVRPANHPRARLRQYGHWGRTRPDWPARLEAAAGAMRDAAIRPDCPTGEARRLLDLSALKLRLAREILDGAVGGSRLDNLFCDGFLPLLAAQTGQNLQPWWFHWYAGDLPGRLPAGLKTLGITDGRTQPLCHGFAQGLLGWRLEREQGRLGSAGPARGGAV